MTANLSFLSHTLTDVQQLWMVLLASEPCSCYSTLGDVLQEVLPRAALTNHHNLRFTALPLAVLEAGEQGCAPSQGSRGEPVSLPFLTSGD